MRLRRLELQGFKTFAARATLEFAPGITAVVGPNGSGKSNVADAVRWVLGEQSLRLLRGRKSEDVIFAGGSARAPLGLADVTLVLDNADGVLPTDFSEVAVGRQIYRSGESEYYINRARVRLRDVVDLLSRAGIDQNGHSVIGQGLVDLALSLRPEERRSLFEDAAGVRRYQVKRDEAESRLTEVRANATRLADLVAELEPRLGQLQRQARRAQEEGRLRERWREALRAWAARLRWELASSRAGLEGEAAGVASERLTAEAAAAQATIAEREAQAAGEALSAELAGWQARQDAAREALDAVRRDLAVQRERQGAAARGAADLAAERQRLTLRLATASAEREAAAAAQAHATAEAAAAQETAERHRRAASERASARGGTGGPADLTEARRETADAARAVTQVTTQLREVERQQAGMEKQATEAAEGRARAERSLQSLGGRLETLQTTIDATQRQAADAQHARNALAQRRRAAHDSLEQLTVDSTRLDREIDSCRVRLSVLDDLVGPPAAAGSSAIVSGPAGGSGASGTAAPGVRELGVTIGRETTVAAHLCVPPELEAAVAAAVGPALQWVVMDSFQQATERALARAAEGGPRVTYAARDRLLLGRDGAVPISPATGPRSMAVELPAGGATGDVGTAGGTAGGSADPLSLYSAVAGGAPERGGSASGDADDALRRRLLGGVRLAETLPAALALLERWHGKGAVKDGEPAERAATTEAPGTTVVTLRGETVSADGTISAGAPPGEAALLQRTRERRELALQLTRAVAERAALDAPLAEARRQVEADTAEERRLEGAGRALTQQASREEGERRALSQQQTRLEGDVRWWGDFAARVTAQQASLSERVAHLRQQAGAVQDQHTAAIQRLQRLTAALQRRQADLAALREGETRSRSALDLAEGRRGQATQRLAAAITAAAAASEDLERVDARLATSKAASAATLAAVQALVQRVTDNEQMIGAERAAGERLRTAAAEQTTAAAAARQAAQRVRDAVAAGQARAAVLHERLAALTEREQALEEQADRDLGELPEPVEGIEDAAALRRTVEGAEARLRGLGPVNQVALQEHAEASERLEFMKGQLTDLHQAVTTLEAARDELDAGLQADFAQTFHAVAEQFRLYFSRLFGGGEAELRLTQPSNLAETGVEIMVRLPGKRRQELSLLSGGERALVAAALLFALVSARPSPFCILDEVDAALDEANVTRFCDALEELSAQTQFVIITHNRATMERAGALYGVTMGEDGVSRVLSLRLADAVQMVGSRAEATKRDGTTNGVSQSNGATHSVALTRNVAAPEAGPAREERRDGAVRRARPGP